MSKKNWENLYGSKLALKHGIAVYIVQNETTIFSLELFKRGNFFLGHPLQCSQFVQSLSSDWNTGYGPGCSISFKLCFITFSQYTGELKKVYEFVML